MFDLAELLCYTLFQLGASSLASGQDLPSHGVVHRRTEG